VEVDASEGEEDALDICEKESRGQLRVTKR